MISITDSWFGQKPHRGPTCADVLKNTAKTELTNPWPITAGWLTAWYVKVYIRILTCCLEQAYKLMITQPNHFQCRTEWNCLWVCWNVCLVKYKGYRQEDIKIKIKKKCEKKCMEWNVLESHLQKCIFGFFCGNQCKSFLWGHLKRTAAKITQRRTDCTRVVNYSAHIFDCLSQTAIVLHAGTVLSHIKNLR